MDLYTIIMIMGIIAYVMFLISFLTGMKIIKVKYKIHRRIGIIGICCASAHALYMLYNSFF
jgi:hypothetical protein